MNTKLIFFKVGKTKIILVLLFTMFYMSSIAQKYIKDSQGNILAYIDQDNFYTKNDIIKYSVEAQLVFNDSSRHKNQIVLSVDILKNKIKIKEGVELQTKWLIQNQRIYYKTHQELLEVVYFDLNTDVLSFYDSRTDSLIAILDGEDINPVHLSLYFYHLWNLYDLEPIIEYGQKSSLDNRFPTETLGYMTPSLGSNEHIWVWNGEKFYLWGNQDQYYTWTFDGKTIKALYNSTIETEWSWNSNELKPFWGGHPAKNWNWEGTILKNAYLNDYKNEYEYIENSIRKRFGSFQDLEWEIHGEVPLALVSFVVLGFCYR